MKGPTGTMNAPHIRTPLICRCLGWPLIGGVPIRGAYWHNEYASFGDTPNFSGAKGCLL